MNDTQSLPIVRMRFTVFRTVYKLEFDEIESDTGNLKHEKIFI
jgi:hypothetical protein